MKRFFKKEMFQRPVFLRSGRALSFDFTIDNTGVVVVDDAADAAFAEELKKNCGKFGISEMTEAQYTELKKKKPTPQREAAPTQLRIFEHKRDPFAAKKVPIAVKDVSQIPQAPPPPAQPATAPASVPPAADSNPADGAAEKDPSSFKPRTGTARSKKAKE